MIASDSYRVNSQSSHIYWQVERYFGLKITGYWKPRGEITFDPNNPKNSAISIEIPMAELNVRNLTLKRRLLGKGFFNVESYPTSHFESTKVITKGTDIVEIVGNLTLNGLTKPTTIEVKGHQYIYDSIRKTAVLKFYGRAKILRSDFNIHPFLPLVSNEVILAVDIVAYKIGT